MNHSNRRRRPHRHDRSRTTPSPTLTSCYGTSSACTSVPRPEDFPVQPVITCGFKLMPVGFFDANPAIDLPPEVNHASARAAHACCA